LRSLTALALIVVLAPSPSTATPGAGAPRGWVLLGPTDAYSAGVDSAERHSGHGSGLLECTVWDVEVFGTLMQTLRADAYRGRRLRLSGYLRTRDVEGSARMWLRVDGPDASPIAMDNMAKRPVRGNTEWSRYEIVLDVPAVAVQVAYGAILGGKGRLWVDDLRLEVVGNDVPSTDMHMPAVPTKTAVPPDLPSQPVNAGFEE
jgi:hypothetical protein